ncbi:DNA repair protein rad52 [Haplosporangium sp. Z 27]|nr:DNA repair protein rad52 [Haplosporangium sp. Z 27]
MASNGASEFHYDIPTLVTRVPQNACSSHQATRLLTFTPEEKVQLNEDLPKYLPPEFVATRPGPGRSTLTYIEGWRIKNLANKLFGFDGWSSSITDVTVDFMDLDHEGKVSVGVSVMVKVTLKDGTFHEDIGYGSSENQKSKAASFEKAKKEATTDALKRALTSFGNVLGTCLYDKNFCKHLSMQKVDKPKFDSKEMYYYPTEAKPAHFGAGSSSTAVKSNPYQAINPGSSANAILPQANTNPSGQPRPMTTQFTKNSDVVEIQDGHKSEESKDVKAEEDDDLFFGADFEEPRPSQPESPRMSDFDFHVDVMDMMTVDDSPVKPRTSTPGTDEGSNDVVSATPPSLRRSGTFSRSTSSPSVVQTTPTKSTPPVTTQRREQRQKQEQVKLPSQSVSQRLAQFKMTTTPSKQSGSTPPTPNNNPFALKENIPSSSTKAPASSPFQAHHGLFSNRQTSSAKQPQNQPYKHGNDASSAFNSALSSNSPHNVTVSNGKNVLRANSMAAAALSNISPSAPQNNQSRVTSGHKQGTTNSSTTQHNVHLLNPVQGSGLKRPFGMSATDGQASVVHKEARLG